MTLTEECNRRVKEIEQLKPRTSEQLLDKLLEEEAAGIPLPIGDEDIISRIEERGWYHKSVTKWIGAEIYAMIRGIIRYRGKEPEPAPELVLASLSANDKRRLEHARRLFEVEYLTKTKQAEKELREKYADLISTGLNSNI